jgi:KDO2-lipid IV(A) lauroyltransferase
VTLRHRALDALAWALARTPLWLATVWSWALAWLWWTVLPVRRDVAASNMAQAFPEMGAAERGRALRRMFHDLVLGYVELLRGLHRPERFDSMCRTEGLELLTERQARGEACLVLVGHFGSWDLVLLAMGRGRGLNLSCIVKPPADPWSAALVERARRARDVELIPPRHSMDRVYDAIEKGRIVVFAGDQRFNEGIELPFLGRPAWTATGLAAAARRSRVPVFLVWQCREGPGRHVMHVSPAFEHRWTDDAEADIARATAQYNEALAACIRRRPHGWLWLHKRWRGARSEPGS